MIVRCRIVLDDEQNRRVVREVSVSAALEEAQRTRLIDICERRPVTLFLKRGTTITTTWH